MSKKFKTYQSKLHILNIDDSGNHVLIKAKVNKNKVNMIVDTGASSTVFDVENPIFSDIEFENLETDNPSSGFNSVIEELYYGNIDSFSISWFKIKNFEAVFTSMQHINYLYKNLNLPPVAGILGCDFLIENNAVLDFENKKLIIKKPINP
ncbi:MAG TPA: retropepsin-like aspartic protease [Bacteroidales bacterium]|nr:retropepsin-like aspartic protease [Bacteroidales bacterium]HPL04284.1 retropepsin-like aspartic protease [Bacteroidales bacterium]